MKHTNLTLAICLALAASCVSCDKLKPALPEVQQKAPTAKHTSQPDGDHTAFTEDAQKDLDTLRAMVAELKVQATNASQETRAKLQDDMVKLEDELRATQQHLTDLKSATAGSWQQLKASFSQSLKRLMDATEKLRKTTL